MIENKKKKKKKLQHCDIPYATIIEIYNVIDYCKLYIYLNLSAY